MVLINHKWMKVIVSVCFVWIVFVGFSNLQWNKQVRQFYADLNTGDSTLIGNHFNAHASITFIEEDTSIYVSVPDFLKQSFYFESGKFQEKVVWVRVFDSTDRLVKCKAFFEFYVNDKLSKTGIDELIYVRDEKGQYKIDKVYSYPFEQVDDEKEVNQLLNDWHLAASNAHLNDYFKVMHPDFIFLGTDPKERWSKSEFYNFCKPYFNKGQAWDFKVNWRNVYFSPDHKTAWFEESLETWMEECRGSGVLIFVNGSWQIIHYNLTVLIENEKVKKFIKLRKK